MHILVTWASRGGGTEGIAAMIADELERDGHDVTARPADELDRVGAADAVIVGSGLYANRWLRAARRFVARNEVFLRTVPTWFFSSGPLDDSARRDEIAPVREVAVAMDRIGALGHATFGGRLAPDAKGFIASKMARTHAGDWRDEAQIRAWAADVARRVPIARPGPAVAPPGGSLARMVAHGVVGWAACAAAALALARVETAWLAHVAYDLFVGVIYALIALHYFKPRGAGAPLAAAAVFAATFALLGSGRGVRLGDVAGLWIPLIAIAVITAAIGSIAAMMPSGPRPRPRGPSVHAHAAR